MTTAADIREQIRQRAHFACEFCGMSETDTGGELTIDHFQPQAHAGSNNIANLLYCCARCNVYKADYWPTSPADVPLWNPRKEPAFRHFIELEDGTLQPLTPTGTLTTKLLRLNRSPLVALRLRRKQKAETARLMIRYRDLAFLLAQLQKQSAALMEEQQKLLEEQRELLQRLLANQK